MLNNMDCVRDNEFYRKEITKMLKDMDKIRYLEFIYNLMINSFRKDKEKDTA